MARYQYSAYDQQGRLEEKEIEAIDLASVSAALSRSGLYPFDIREAGAARAGRNSATTTTSARPMRLVRLAGLMRELATLIDADVPIDQALGLLASGPANGGIQIVATALLQRVRNGAALSEAMQGQNGAIPEYCVSMVQAGEASGSLGPVLSDLANLIDRRVEMQARLRSALVYPLILVAMALVAVILIVSVLVPSLAPLFEDSGAEPPAAMQVLLWLHDVVALRWPQVLAGLGLFGALLVMALRTASVRYFGDWLALRLPLLSGLVARAETARLTQTLAALIRGGVVLPRALAIATLVARNRVVKAAMERISEEVKEGASLSMLLEKAVVIPPMALRLVAIGEETGRLDKMLAHVARIAETELTRRIEMLMGLLTPLLTILIGLGVGGLIYSVMTTILRVNDMALR